jgi:SEC-C motif-containing protein
MLCPCGRPRDLAECCGALIAGHGIAQTAEDLMRSRFTAYATPAIDWLLATHDPPPARAGVEDFAARARFTGLRIIATKDGGPTDDTGEVEFEATFEENGIPQTLHERSKFERRAGSWRYTASLPIPKVSRNDPCPCGSGKKYKKCHG